MAIKAICFDLDNTLYDHEQFIAGAYKDISKVVSGIFAVDQHQVYKFVITRWREMKSQYPHIFEETLCKFGTYDEKLAKQVLEIYHAHHPTLSLYDGVFEALSKLKPQYRLGLLTDGEVRTQARKVKALGIERFFDAIVYTGKYGKEFYKPHLLGYQKILERLAVRPHELISVGDNPLVDFEGANKLGISTIRLLKGEYKDIPSKDCSEFEIEVIAEIFLILERIE